MDEQELHAVFNKSCEPLYLLDRFLHSGHSEETANATVTYVKHRGKHYAVTCRHVVEGLLERNATSGTKLNLATSFQRTFSFFHRLDVASGVLVSSFALPDLDEVPDIAIHAFPGSLPMAQTSKGKEPIDLDQFAEVTWGDVKLCAAAGFGSEHKYRDAEKVAASMHVVTAGLANNVSVDSKMIILSSTLERAHNTYFSGMSGGPVFADDGDAAPKFAGIVFEGNPGGSEAWKQRKPDEMFLSEEDILIYALRVTPGIFDKWVDACDWDRPLS